MKEKKICWGILGTGQIARQFAEGLGYVDDAILYAVGSRSEEKAKLFAEQFAIERAYGSFEALVSNPQVDVVYIASPHHVHHAHCLMALEAGKPVLCEKPFTINAEQAKEVITLARSKQLFCMEAMWMRFIPAIVRVKELLEAGAIGKPGFFRADFGVRFQFDPNARRFDLNLAGGALLDLGIYTVSLAHQLFGAPKEITSSVNIGETGVDESASILLRHEGGETSSLQCSFRHQMPNEAAVFGSKGNITIQAPMYRPHKITLERFDLVKLPNDKTFASNSSSMPSKIKAMIKQSPLLQKLVLYLENYLGPVIQAKNNQVIAFQGNGYNYEAAEVNRCLKQGKLESDIMPLDDSLAVLQTLDELRMQWGLRHAENSGKSVTKTSSVTS